MSDTKNLARSLDALRQQKPLVHCITNYVTVNDCANALLAIGASPVMADDIAEAAEIAALSGALVINIGTLNERTIGSMRAAAQEAVRLHTPVILDPVGAGASHLRTDTALALIAEIPFSVIRGNVSEIRTLLAGSGNTRGVDAAEDTKEDLAAADVATALSRRTGAIVAITGAVDIVTDSTTTCFIRNGHPLMSRITGTGCMLTALAGAFCAASKDDLLSATASAVCAMGLAGEKAVTRITGEGRGTGSLRAFLLDELSLMTADSLAEGMNYEMC